MREYSSVDCFAPELSTVYFGGGSPALCDLRPLLNALASRLGDEGEFTVELHPLDVNAETLSMLKDCGVNRISMGVQSLDDGILADMGRGYSFCEAEKAFALVKEYFDNAGIDLIAGLPGETSALVPRHARLAKWGLMHCSVYSLILEEKTRLWKDVHSGKTSVIDDDTVMDRIKVISAFLSDIGLERYEISNYAVRGFECRHNLAVWRGEDYVGLGEGACGRMGRLRTCNWRFPGESAEKLSPEQDMKERTIFSLRTRDGLDATLFPRWIPALDRFAAEGLLVKDGSVYRLTDRGREVCDTILSEIV